MPRSSACCFCIPSNGSGCTAAGRSRRREDRRRRTKKRSKIAALCPEEASEFSVQQRPELYSLCLLCASVSRFSCPRRDSVDNSASDERCSDWLSRQGEVDGRQEAGRPVVADVY